MSRTSIATRANQAGRESRRGGAPHLTASSSRLTLIDWLVWNDPNGSYTDDDSEADDRDPMTTDEAWELIDESLRDNGY